MVKRNEIRAINMVGLRRAGFDMESRRRIQTAYRELFGAPSLADGLDAVRSLGDGHAGIGEILAFFEVATKRGFCRPPAGHALGDATEE